MFHPTIEQLHDSILACFHNTISDFPPPHAPGTLPPSAPPYRLGDYLVDLGYLLPHELEDVLARAWHQYEQPPAPLGYILAARGLIPIPVLATVLVLQGLDRLEHLAPLAPRLLGEQLLIDGYLRPEQLALVLEEQMLDYRHGQWSQLDSLILRHGWIDQATLVQEAERQGQCN
jgi:hypothetical protein